MKKHKNDLKNIPSLRKDTKKSTFALFLISGLIVMIFSYSLGIDKNDNTIAYAQKQPLSPTQQKMPIHIGVKITYPIKGQQLPITTASSGKNISISGISTDNATANCKVSVIVNGIKPYQPSMAKGTGGSSDYSKWIFLLSPKYTTIKQGINEITAKLTCISTPNNLTKWYGVNVTGIGS
jgi:hypothetical protein